MTHPTVSHIRIDQDRLWSSLQDLGELGAYDDGETGLRGVRRLALTDEDIQGRQLVLGWMENAGLTIRIDQMGNIYARRAGGSDSLPPVMMGSHIDSVGTAGKFDGCLGVLGGLEVIRTLNENDVVTLRPLELAIFTEEEGVRFGTDMLGSAVAAGRLLLEQALEIQDRDGTSVRTELERHGLIGDVQVPITPPYAYLECHIEQGPILAAATRQIGVVQGIQAITWKELHITGRAAHAGATPQTLRRNAGLAAAMITVQLNEMVESGRYGQMLATVGRHDSYPNLINIVPAKVLMTVDMRNPDGDSMRLMESHLDRYLAEVERATGVSIASRTTAKTPPVAFPIRMRELVAKTATNLGFSYMEITSGAGHDAGEIASISPAGMVFIPGLYDGISHNPREYSTPEACADGINVLLQAVVELANHPAVSLEAHTSGSALVL
ncbi:hydantoinase/carbamoylase family amidase [Arthrobacter sp. FW306-04-A]|uniref:hydantoinase/carbamoylase family amidase n=1 Tax=Arthrobacter sp. FW306-04-A TaxID=2879619 RepID=UPI0037C10D07|nr:hydantoinase/carbamoylase family amidase [Arthrobacter sp. FW306-04-A]